MDTRIKILLDSNPDYKRYIRSNSYWYKTLNRNPEMFDVFVNEVKEKYKLRTTDKLNNIIDKIDMVSKFINVLR
ncbi:MAG: YlbE-like family protein [Bacilli bacterium]|nr:YlbE-like family protein [Bacilli bacterium]